MIWTIARSHLTPRSMSMLDTFDNLFFSSDEATWRTHSVTRPTPTTGAKRRILNHLLGATRPPLVKDATLVRAILMEVTWALGRDTRRKTN